MSIMTPIITLVVHVVVAVHHQRCHQTDDIDGISGVSGMVGFSGVCRGVIVVDIDH